MEKLPRRSNNKSGVVETFGTATQNILKNLGEIVPRLGKTGLEVAGAIADEGNSFQRRKVLLMQLEHY